MSSIYVPDKSIHFNKYLIIAFVFLFVGISSSSLAARERNILILHSYHQGLEWTDSISSGISSIFKTHPNYNLYFEYLDTKRNSSETYLHSLVDLYHARSSKIKYDAIIACDNAAYDFMCQYRDEFFPATPVFFCGVNFLDKEKLNSQKKFYGFEEVADHKGTLLMLNELFPQRKKVLIVNDNTKTGKAIRNELEEILPAFKGTFDFEFFDAFTIGELKEKVSTLDNDYSIYLLVVNMDREGQYISYNNGIKIIEENTPVPIFGSWDFYLGKGIIGGSIIRGFSQGKSIAQLTFNYLEGINTSPSIYQKGASTSCLDYNLLIEHGLEANLLTKNAIVINKPEVSQQRIIMLEIGIGLLLTLLLVLYIYLQLKKRQNKKLKELVEQRTSELKETNADLEKINKDKNEIIGVVAHDLRSPIGNINGFSSLLLEDNEFEKELNEESRSYIKIIHDLSENMLKLVNNLLDISAIESGCVKLNLSTHDYLSFIETKITENQAVLKRQNVSIDFQSNIQGVMLKFDSVKIEQVFINILSNALKFSKPGDVISVFAEQKNGHIITRIKDQGPGISEDKFDAIFKKFMQINAKEKGKLKGVGLGLSIVKGIIEAHHGRIYVKSRYGEGAEFIFELPLINSN